MTRHFLRNFSEELSLEGKISKEAISYLTRQSWPGNVRQLQNVLRRALLKRRELVIGREDLRELIQQTESAPRGSALTLESLSNRVLEEAESHGEGSALRSAVAELEAVLIREALRRTGGNQSKAARWLGITRLTLREKIKSLPGA
jgi:DNA-binding NtrC family response regulator